MTYTLAVIAAIFGTWLIAACIGYICFRLLIL
jgi:hypothetical protein